MNGSRIRVLCVDDHRIVRDGIALIIGQEPDMHVVGAAATGHEAVALFDRHQPDVTLMDLRLGETSGVDAIREIRSRSPEARIVVLTMYEGDEDIYRAHEAGAVTYLLKDTLASDLIRVLRLVHAGHRPLLPEIEARLALRATRPSLTARETQVLDLMAAGMRNKEIGTALGIAEGTVQNHAKSIFAKLSVNDRNAAVYVAARRGLVHLG